MIVIATAVCLAAAPAMAGDGGRGYGAGGSNGAGESGAPGSATGNASGRGLGSVSYESALQAAYRDARAYTASERARVERAFRDAWNGSVHDYYSRGGGDGHVAGSGAPGFGGYGRDGTNFGH